MKRQLTNKHGLSTSMVNALSLDTYSGRIEGSKDFSVTELLNPVKLILLERRYKDEIKEDVSDRVWTMLGSAIHQVIEYANTTQPMLDMMDLFKEHVLNKYCETGYNENIFLSLVKDFCVNVLDKNLLTILAEAERNKTIVSEKRRTFLHRGYSISGATDQLDLNACVIEDNKFVFTRSYVHRYDNGTVDKWTKQLNMYAMMARLDGATIKGIMINAIFKDFNKYMISKSGYPTNAIIHIGLSLYPNEYTMDWVNDKIDEYEKYKDVPDDAIPICPPEDRWHHGDKWLLKKIGNAGVSGTANKDDNEDITKLDNKLITMENNMINAYKKSRKTPVTPEKELDKRKAFRDQYEIIFVEGEDRRCKEGYCKIAHRCNHGRKVLGLDKVKDDAKNEPTLNFIGE